MTSVETPARVATGWTAEIRIGTVVARPAHYDLEVEAWWPATVWTVIEIEGLRGDGQLVVRGVSGDHDVNDLDLISVARNVHATERWLNPAAAAPALDQTFARVGPPVAWRTWVPRLQSGEPQQVPALIRPVIGDVQ